MSFEAMTWACHQELPCNQKMVLLMLANRTNPDTGQCTPSHDRLTRDCGMSKTTVKDCIGRLESAGLLEILRRSHEGVSLPNSYRLVMREVGRQPTHPVETTDGVGREPTGGGSPADRGVGRQPTTKQRVETEKGNREKKQGLPAPDGVSDPVWTDYLALRKAKGAPVTATVIAGLQREAGKAGYTLEDAIRACCERGWQGFNASWVQRDTQAVTQPRRQSAQQDRRDAWEQDFAAVKARLNDDQGAPDANSDDRTVEVEARVVGG